MTNFIHNIGSVSKYESKLLLRSWFFKIFTILVLFILTIWNLAIFVFPDGGGVWAITAIPSNIPYLNLLMLNMGQAVIAIFLASDFLKRDKKLDTSEVFYVRPLSNAEYVIGKIWGNLRVFLVLNLIVMGLALFFSFIGGVTTDWESYLIYFFFISIPTLIYIIGLSIFLMLLLGNQALTFILLLGYVGLSLFYINDKFYYLFDYMAFYLPLMKSSIVGFTNLDAILTHRSIYLFAGLGFICITISQFRRLPNSSRSHYPWLILAALLLGGTGYSGYKHVQNILDQNDIRKVYVEINNQYVNSPKMVVDEYQIDVEQHPQTISSSVTMQAMALEESSVFAFCLNPGLQVKEIRALDQSLSYEREEQILLIDFGRKLSAGEKVSLQITYEGTVENSFCYLDIPEEDMQKENRTFLFSADKKYTFQTPTYLLFTPESYWYPRPGTAYSDQDPNWQQSYFSRFQLRVKPLPGLTPISQGAGVAEEDGSFTFQPEYPVQAITLLAGRYEQKSVVASDSIEYSVWHLEKQDYFVAVFDSIRDTIPHLLVDFKENMERQYKLQYPFSRFSLIEVPAQFSTYPHAWSEAQETIHPEMILMVEKNWKNDSFDFKKRVDLQKQMAKRRGQEINDEEAQIRTVNNVFYSFSRAEGTYSYQSSGRGEMNITSEANPYFLFPLLYNFRYNIYSPEWPVANRLVELYLQNKTDNSGWEREVNGISNNEKANLLMEKLSFRELLADKEHRDLMSSIIGLKSNRLFAPAEINIGIATFRDSVYAFLDRNMFKNIQFESMLDTLEQISGASMRPHIATWDKPTALPVFTIVPADIAKYSHRGEDAFVMSILVSNNSDQEGIIHLDILDNSRMVENRDPRTSRKIWLAPQQTKELVSVWEDAPRNVTIHTMISGNLPNSMTQPINNIRQERGVSMAQEGDYILEGGIPEVWGEVIVDNEDSTLFVLSEPERVGLLTKLLDETEETSFKYAGVSWWRPPYQWTPTTNAGYYGKYIRSAYIIKSGNGNQTATWKVPVPSEGHYELYYYVYRDEDIRRGRGGDGEYHFKIDYDGELEDAYLNLRRANDGWEQLGVYYIASDTLKVTLTNESRLRNVSADAVKIVKR
ncbi:ABC-type transport system involved in multi-copper enzyme maturation permease subunit [Parabacteroides sp. PFB2-10]|uniref:golvesin C-terminal-like domain-containing protein n=1 Tax=Parabacteroides sp. PFB2-10 TaxID=1742405 RepID=UPI002476B1BF|nr:ABC transporter permease subunit [Parabacteroides sp. PFB2-10]MDH6314039.1 ABC-type transport system involved in multi-copper enzyme maturation permease subunit [Parabacteroides sp. PFB2-10]